MIKDGKNKLFDTILVHKFDRFARNREDSVIYKSLLRKDGIKVISVTESIEDDKFNIILESMLEAMAEYYSINLSDEVKKGMNEKALRGEFQTAPPFGYKKTKGKELEINEEEKDYVVFIYKEFLKGISMFEIAEKLNKKNILTHRQNKFTARQVKYILSNPIYTGLVKWTPDKGELPILVKGSHQSIIDENTFKVAEKKLKKLKEKYKKMPDKVYKHYLSGLLKCSNCSSSLVYSKKNNSFQCSKYSKGKCKISHYISADKVEKIIKNEIITNFPVTHTYIKNSKNNIDISKDINRLIARKEKLKNIYLSEIITLDELKTDVEKINEEIKKIENSINTDYTKITKTEDIFNLPYNQLNILLSQLIDKIIFEKSTKSLIICYNF